jgi:hypothetical protein
MIIVGDTLHIPSGQNKHLFTIILGPIVIKDRGNIKQYVLVNFSSIKPEDNHDTTCEVSVGEHPNITRPSYIVYHKAEIKREDDVLKGLKQGTYKKSSVCPPALLAKITIGALQSKLIGREIKKLLQDNI